jgi:hypothetical protein
MPGTDALYRRLIGDAFDSLPPAVRAVHGCSAGVRAVGRCEVRRGRGLLSRLVARWLGVPPEGRDVALTFDIHTHAGGEDWVRHFGSHVMRSRFWTPGQGLYERLGPIVMLHSLETSGGKLATRLLRLWFLGIPVPKAAYPRIRALADGDGDAYRFDVAAELPWVGLVVSYRGWLQVEGGTGE